MEVRKAVIPCAGFGTRFLPITKIVPKELLPIVDKPTLGYIVDEAIASGISEILIVISPQKNIIRKYFAPNAELNKLLLQNNKKAEYDEANKPIGAKISFAVQKKMNGNGMAIYAARRFAAGEPVAVLFGDDLMYTGDGVPVTKQLIDAYVATGGKSVVGCQQVAEDVARRCGVMVVSGETEGKITEISSIVEKPKEALPSKLVSLGRFVLSPEIFATLEKTEPTLDGEVFLTEAISLLAKDGKAVACEFDGKRYDIGNKNGYLEATVEYALRNDLLKDKFNAYLEQYSKTPKNKN